MHSLVFAVQNICEAHPLVILFESCKKARIYRGVASCGVMARRPPIIVPIQMATEYKYLDGRRSRRTFLNAYLGVLLASAALIAERSHFHAGRSSA